MEENDLWRKISYFLIGNRKKYSSEILLVSLWPVALPTWFVFFPICHVWLELIRQYTQRWWYAMCLHFIKLNIEWSVTVYRTKTRRQTMAFSVAHSNSMAQCGQLIGRNTGLTSLGLTAKTDIFSGRPSADRNFHSRITNCVELNNIFGVI